MTTLDLHCTAERKIVDLSLLRLPGAKVLGRYIYQRPHPSLPPHRHAGMLEICYLHRGRQQYEVEGKSFLLSGGDIFITFPGERHSTGPEPEDRGVLYWLILKIHPLPRHFLGHAGSTANVLAKRLSNVPQRCFRAPLRSRGILERILRFSEPGARDPLARIAASHHLTEFLLSVLLAAEKGRRPDSEKWLSDVLEYMDHHLEENLQVPDFAAISRLSVSRFKARFREIVGTAPAEFFLAKRIRAAQERLARTSLPVTRIAHDLGFSSSQSFATTFRRFSGKTPTDFRSNPSGYVSVKYAG